MSSKKEASSSKTSAPPVPTPPARQPVIFLSHGSPSMPIDVDNPKGMQHAFGAYLRKTFRKEHVPTPPRAIVIVSAHWETRGHRATTASGTDGVHETIHDFGGFPRALYEMEYPAAGDASVAARVVKLAESAGITNVSLDKSRGLDHGAWSPLITIWPEADIPVVQLSLDKSFDGEDHVALGRALAPLREEGVMLIASGGATHNLRLAFVPDEFLDKDDKEANAEFDGWLKETLTKKTGEERNKELIAFKERNPQWSRVHPRLEHWAPVYFAAGAAGEEAGECFWDEALSVLSLRSYIWA